MRVPFGIGGTKVVFELPRGAPVLIGKEDDPLFIILEGEGPRLILNDERAVQAICAHRMKVGVPESCSRRVGSEVVFHPLLSRDGALVLGGESVRVRGSSLMNSMPVNLGNKAI